MCTTQPSHVSPCAALHSQRVRASGALSVRVMGMRMLEVAVLLVMNTQNESDDATIANILLPPRQPHSNHYKKFLLVLFIAMACSSLLKV